MVKLRKKTALTAALIGLVGFSLAALYRHLVINGLEAEAKIMLAYMHSLEAAHQMETGRYVFFSDWYGAPIDGRNNCNQPDGARDLGFMIRWCRGDGKGQMMRFAYRVVPATNGSGFAIQARSGSDAAKESFVCFGASKSQWILDENRQLNRSDGC